MSNIVKAKVKVRGTRPFWQHRFGPEALPLEKKEKTGVAGNNPEEWRQTAMVNKDGQLFFEGTYIFGSLREAAKYTKRGRASLQKPVAATLQILEDRILLDRFFPGFPNGHKFDIATVEELPRDQEELVYLDVRGVVNPSTRGRNVRYRVAASPGWQTEFTIMFDKTIVSRNEMEAILIDAGRLVGIGNGRTIGMGRFEVEQFECE
jgi:hypothetical protein